MAHGFPIFVFLLASILASAQQGSSPKDGAKSAKSGDAAKPRQDATPETIHRLESVTWDPLRCELTWVVSTGTQTGREYVASEKQTYKIAMDLAIMQAGSERRRFETQEADRVHLLMDVISRYAAESTVWWLQGEGDKIEESGPVAKHQPAVDSSTTDRQLAPFSGAR